MAVIGHDTVETDNSNILDDYIVSNRFTCPVSGNLNSILLWIESVSVAGNFRMAVYSNNAGVPDVLLAESNEIAATGSAWNSASLPGLAVTNGTIYHLAFRADGTANFVVKQHNVAPATPGQYFFKDPPATGYPTWENPITGGLTFDSEVSIYAPITEPVAGQEIILMGDGLT